MGPAPLSENDFKYKLDFLKRFNALYYQGKPLSHLKIFGKYNVWIFFQSRIFFNDLRELGKGKTALDSRKHLLKVSIQNFLLATFGVLESFAAAVFASIFRRKLLVYGIDRDNSPIFWNDARMDPVYQYLKSSQEPFLEFLHTTFDISFLKRFFHRRRWAFYVRAIDSLFFLFSFLGFIDKTHLALEDVDLSSFSEKERPFARDLLHRYLRAIDRSVFKVKVLRLVLPWMGAKTLLAIDNTRDYWELVLASRMKGIKVYAFQHGHFTKYHVGWLSDGSFDGEIAHPDKLLVWSSYWKDELLRLGTYFPESSIEVGGLKNEVAASPEKTKRDYVGVLVPYEVDSNKAEVKKYMDNMLSCGDIRILFKLRTDTDADRQMNEYMIDRNYHPNLAFITDAPEHMHEVDAVAGTYSTFLYDMVAYERPIALLETSSDFGEGLAINGLAEKAGMDDICEKMKKLATTPKEVLIERKERLFGKSPALMYHTVLRLCGRK